MTIQAGEFWVAEILFTNGLGTKKRPVLVLWINGDDVVVAVVTSAKPRTTQTDVVLKDWAISGLRVASTVRSSRLDCIEKSLLIGKIDKISEADALQVKYVWDLYVDPQF